MGANASTAVPLYASGQVLDAARLNLTNAGVPVFSGTATRDAAFGGSGEKVLAEGQLCYLEDTNAVQFYDGAAFQSISKGILQVVSTSKTDTFTTTAGVGSPVLVTGLTATITPQSTTSKIYVVANVSVGMDTTENQVFLFLYRGGSPIIQGDTIGSRTRVTAQATVGGPTFQEMVTMTFLDSPSSIASLTYQVYISKNIGPGNGTATVNRSFTNSNAASEAASTSTITVFEVSA